MEEEAGSPVLSNLGGGVNVRDQSNVGVWASFFTVLLSIPALVGS